MAYFKYKKNELYCERVPVSKIAKAVGTPFYLYSINAFADQYRRLAHALRGLDHLICYSVKANSNLTVLGRLIREGAGLDIVSGGELYRSLKVGADPKKIVFASVGKTEAEIAESIRARILIFNVESEEELVALNRVASRVKKIQPVALRINPEVEPDTHHYIATGRRESKFGIDMGTAFRIFQESYRFPHLRLSGIHLHIGSQITKTKPFVEAVGKAMHFIQRLRMTGIMIESINIGGGLGIVYTNEKAKTPEEYAEALRPLLAGSGLKLILEPGRFIAGNSGILVTKTLYWKKTRSKRYAIVDAAMNDLLRPSIYDAYHRIIPVRNNRGGKRRITRVDIVGPICESGDFLGKNRSFTRLDGGSLLAVMSAGAYGFSMSSNYNSRPRVPEVVVSGTKFVVARKRETYKDLIKSERIFRI